MAKNTVAANLLMMFIIVGGLLNLRTTKQEVFPEFEVDLVTVGVAYPGASPSEVEQEITMAVEETVRGIQGSSASPRRRWRDTRASLPS